MFFSYFESKSTFIFVLVLGRSHLCSQFEQNSEPNFQLLFFIFLFFVFGTKKKLFTYFESKSVLWPVGNHLFFTQFEQKSEPNFQFQKKLFSHFESKNLKTPLFFALVLCQSHLFTEFEQKSEPNFQLVLFFTNKSFFLISSQKAPFFLFWY